MAHNIKTLEALFKGLANRRRIAIVQYLRSKKDSTVGDIAEEIKLSFKATSRHLALLCAANILERDQRGIYMHYRLSTDMSDAARKVISLL